MRNMKENIMNLVKEEIYDCDIPAVVVGDIIRFNNKVIDNELACELFDEVYLAELIKAREELFVKLSKSGSTIIKRGDIEKIIKDSVYGRLRELAKYIKLDTGDVNTSFSFEFFGDKEVLEKAIRINPSLLMKYSKIPKYDYILKTVIDDSVLNNVGLYKSAILVKPNIIYFSGDKVRKNIDVAMNYIDSGAGNLDVFSHKVTDSRDVLVYLMLKQINDGMYSSYNDLMEAVLSVLKKSRYAITDKNMLEFKRELQNKISFFNESVIITDTRYIEDMFDNFIYYKLGLSDELLDRYYSLVNRDDKILKKTS